MDEMEMGGIVMDVARSRKSEGGDDLHKQTKEQREDGIEGD